MNEIFAAKMRDIPLTLFEKGITATLATSSPLIDEMDWWAAKTKYNYLEDRPYTDAEKQAGAKRIVNALWPEKKTQDLRNRLGGKEPVFITVPSTSGQNKLVPALAERLCQDWGLDKDVAVIEGEEIAKFLHSEPMKGIPREARPYASREYLLLSPQTLRQQVAERAVVIVEDVFSSGASAKGFCDALAEQDIQVTTVVGLLGDSQLSCEPQLVSKLRRTLKNASISIKAKDIATVLSRGQVNILIDNINSAKDKNEYERIAANLQRILDCRAARYLGENSWRRSQEYSHGNDERTQRLCTGVRTHAGCTGGDGPEESERGESQPEITSHNNTRDRKGGLEL